MNFKATMLEHNYAFESTNAKS